MERSVSRLPGNAFEQAIRQAGNLANEVKARQRLSGIGGQLGYAVQSANTWDLHQTLATTPPFTYQSATFEIVYTGNGSQAFPVVMPYLDIRINGTADANKMSYLYGSGFNGVLGYVSGSNIVFMNDFVYDRTKLENQFVQRWTTGFLYQGSIEYYAKVVAPASSDGTIVLTRLT